jgi:hypothetical protein
MATDYSTLALIILILSLICLYLLSREWNRREKQITELTKRVRDLEQANLQRLPYKSFEEILNGMAALEILEREAEFKTDVIQNAKAHFVNAMAAGTKRENKS